MTNDIRFTAGSFHFIQRPELRGMGFELCQNFNPFQTMTAIHVFVKTGFQRSEQFFTPLW